MSTPKVCVIRNLNNSNEQHPGIDDKYWNSTDLSHYKLKDNIEDYIDFIEILNTEDLFNLINFVIMPNQEYIINIDDFYYDADYVYQAIFKLPADNQKSYNTQLDESNKLAIQLLNEKFFVNGNMIIIKRSLLNQTFDYVDMKIDDVTEILRTQFLHKAVIVKPTNEMSESNYIYNALEINFDQSHLDNSRFFEFRYLDYRLFFHIDKNADKNESNVNHFGSVIYGKKIYGNILISFCDNSDSSPQPLDLNENLLMKIYYLTLYNKKLNTEIDRKKYARDLNIQNKKIENNINTNNKFIHNNFPEVILCPNFYYIIENEYKNINLDEIKDLNLSDYYDNKLVLNDIE